MHKYFHQCKANVWLSEPPDYPALLTSLTQKPPTVESRMRFQCLFAYIYVRVQGLKGCCINTKKSKTSMHKFMVHYA